MIIIVIGSVVSIAVILFLLAIRPQDLPKPVPVSPVAHLEERKAAIYENLRDLQFEYRVGKLSDADYQASKLDLQRELAKVLAEIDSVLGAQPAVPVKAQAAAVQASPKKFVCPHCGAEFPQALKFCGECGKSMKARA